MLNSTHAKEKILSMCFVTNDYLLITTDLKNYSIHLSDNKLFNKNDLADIVDTNTQDITEYITSQPTAKRFVNSI